MSDSKFDTTEPDSFIEKACLAIADMDFSDCCRLARCMLKAFEADDLSNPNKRDDDVELALALRFGAGELLEWFYSKEQTGP